MFFSRVVYGTVSYLSFWVADPDPHYFGRLDPDPHKSEKLHESASKKKIRSCRVWFKNRAMKGRKLTIEA